ncbi:MAG: MoaD/ThiS family protein [Myxococcaceae bacterium]
MATVRIPSQLRSYTRNKAEVPASGATVREVLQDLDRSFPGILARVLDEQGALRRYVNVFHNEEDIRFLKALDTAVSDGDVLTLIPAIAGGALSEAQIQRYSRQILLREVGGAGQLRLLAASVRLEGAGAALLTAAAYVGAGGSRVNATERPILGVEMGFLASASDAAKPLDAVVTDAGFESSLGEGPGELVLREGPVTPVDGAGLIHLGGVGSEGRVVFAGEGTCPDCLASSLRELGAVPRGLEDLVGAVAALVQQRLAIGMGEACGIVTVSPPGMITGGPLLRCAAHAG